MSEPEMFSAYVVIAGPIFYDRNISDKAKLLYGLLAAMTRAPRYYAFARNETLCRFLGGSGPGSGCSERTLQRCLAELVEAGEIEIRDGEGGNKKIRKIYVRRLQPFNPDKFDGVDPDKNDGVTPYNNNINNKKKERRKKEAAAQEDIMAYLDQWATKLGELPEDTIDLIADLHAFVEARKAKGKPILTLNAADLVTSALKRHTRELPDKLPAMRYILRESIAHNWEKLYSIKDSNMDDYASWLQEEYGITKEGEA